MFVRLWPPARGLWQGRKELGAGRDKGSAPASASTSRRSGLTLSLELSCVRRRGQLQTPYRAETGTPGLRVLTPTQVPGRWRKEQRVPEGHQPRGQGPQ